jgi:hypothetical protein
MTTEFQDAIRGLRATGANHSTRKVVEALDKHGREEAELLERYQRFIDESEPPAVRYLVGLIVEDEQRHHRVLEDLANTIAWASLKESPEQVVPSLPARFRGDAAFRSETQNLLRHELRDRAQLRKLRRRLRTYGDVASWDLLIDLMRSDTAKHIRILRFLLSSDPSPSWFGRMLHRLRLQGA